MTQEQICERLQRIIEGVDYQHNEGGMSATERLLLDIEIDIRREADRIAAAPKTEATVAA